MSVLTISIPHQLERAEARKRTEEMVAQFRKEYGGAVGQLEERWTGDTMDFNFTAMGQSVSGRAHIEDRSVRLEIELPWMLSMLAGGLKKSIEERGRKLLERR